jgi:hypothetical protein
MQNASDLGLSSLLPLSDCGRYGSTHAREWSRKAHVRPQAACEVIPPDDGRASGGELVSDKADSPEVGPGLDFVVYFESCCDLSAGAARLEGDEGEVMTH